MLSGKSKAGVIQILGLMYAKDVLSLARTVTNRLIALKHRDEAVEAICIYGQNAADILRRRKVTREVIFNYFHRGGHPVNPKADKLELINVALTLWDCVDECKDESMVIDEMEDDDTLEADYPNFPSNSNASATLHAIPPAYDPKIQEMAETFALWFYNLLNSLHPSYPDRITTETFSSQHFWPDATLVVRAKGPNGTVLDRQCSSSNEVAKYLSNTVLCENVFFKPNMHEGVKGASESHGLVKIMVCGLIHSHNRCIGMFEQVFGLISDLTSNNWKIKFTNLQIIYNQVPSASLTSSQTHMIGYHG